jgi:hypothetical protein
VLVAAARHWRLAGRHAPLLVDLVDEQASAAARGLIRRYPFLAEACQIRPHNGSLATVLGEDGLGEDLLGEDRLGAPDQVFICYDDEEFGLRLALTARQLWHGRERSVVVRLDRLAGFAEAFHGSSGDRLLDEVSGKLRLYRVVEAAADPALIGEDLVERLAQVIHEHYVLNLERRGAAGPATASTVDWAELPDEFKRANRAQAEDIGLKLREIGCVLAPRAGDNGTETFTDPEVDRLAELEHGRWMEERIDSGWRLGARDDKELSHPNLTGWAALAEEIREKNRDVIRELPWILADAGFEIVRIRPEPDLAACLAD